MTLTLKKYKSKLLSLAGFLDVLHRLQSLQASNFTSLKLLLKSEAKIRKKLESTALSFEGERKLCGLLALR